VIQTSVSSCSSARTAASLAASTPDLLAWHPRFERRSAVSRALPAWATEGAGNTAVSREVRQALVSSAVPQTGQALREGTVGRLAN
jgi:hypothetical protein